MTEAELWHMMLLSVEDLFLFAAGIAGFMSLVMWRRATYFMDQLVNRFGVETFAPNWPLIVLFAILLAAFIPACVFFMYQIRRHPELGVEHE